MLLRTFPGFSNEVFSKSGVHEKDLSESKRALLLTIFATGPAVEDEDDIGGDSIGEDDTGDDHKGN
jgi:hypothetical protein